MLMPWCDICILETSRRYVEYLLDITACMRRSRHFAARAGTGGTSGSSNGGVGGRTGEQERVIARWRTHQRVSTAACSCSLVCTREREVVHRAQRHQPTRPTDRELKIRVAECTHRRRGYAVALSLSTSVCPCVHHSVQQPCLLVGEERYRPLKAIYFSDHLPKAKGAGSFDPALDSSRWLRQRYS